MTDVRLLFVARALRMAAYGGLAVVLVLYLDALGMGAPAIGVLLTLTLGGDAIVSLWLTTRADRLGRRRVLVAGAVLMTLAGIVFAATDWFPILLLAATIGVISPTGNEVGPFLAVEQAALSHVVPDDRRTSTFAWYNLYGYVATATGALLSGLVVQALLEGGRAPVEAYRVIVVAYALSGLLIGFVAARVGPAVEAPAPDPTDGIRRRLGLHRSKGIVARLSALFAVDAFAGGFVPQSLMAYWFHLRFGVEPAALGAIFFGANLLAAASALSAARIAARIGLVNTMVFTHLPSNVLLIAVPFMPSVDLAVGVLLLRYTLSQMDVPTRQSYVMSVVDPDERSAAAGVTGIARSTGAAISPALAAPLVASASATVAGLPFLIAGGLKIAYDLALWRAFRSRTPVPGRDDR